MPDCECIEGCPFYNGRIATDMPAVFESMKQNYCLGDNTDCARHMIFRTIGKPLVPADLIPNQIDRAKEILAENGVTI